MIFSRCKFASERVVVPKHPSDYRSSPDASDPEDPAGSRVKCPHHTYPSREAVVFPGRDKNADQGQAARDPRDALSPPATLRTTAHNAHMNQRYCGSAQTRQTQSTDVMQPSEYRHSVAHCSLIDISVRDMSPLRLFVSNDSGISIVRNTRSGPEGRSRV